MKLIDIPLSSYESDPSFAQLPEQGKSEFYTDYFSEWENNIQDEDGMNAYLKEKSDRGWNGIQAQYKLDNPSETTFDSKKLDDMSQVRYADVNTSYGELDYNINKAKVTNYMPEGVSDVARGFSFKPFKFKGNTGYSVHYPNGEFETINNRDLQSPSQLTGFIKEYRSDKFGEGEMDSIVNQIQNTESGIKGAYGSFKKTWESIKQGFSVFDYQNANDASNKFTEKAEQQAERRRNLTGDYMRENGMSEEDVSNFKKSDEANNIAPDLFDNPNAKYKGDPMLGGFDAFSKEKNEAMKSTFDSIAKSKTIKGSSILGDYGVYVQSLPEDQQGDGTVAGFFKKNPSDILPFIAATAISSLPDTIMGVGSSLVGNAAGGPAGGAGLGGGYGFAREYTATLLGEMQERAAKEKAVFSPELMQTYLDDTEFMQETESKAATRAGVIGTADAVFGGVVGAVGRAVRGAVAKTALTTGLEVLSEGAGEALAGVATNDFSMDDTAQEIFGALGAAAPMAPVSYYGARKEESLKEKAAAKAEALKTAASSQAPIVTADKQAALDRLNKAKADAGLAVVPAARPEESAPTPKPSVDPQLTEPNSVQAINADNQVTFKTDRAGSEYIFSNGTTTRKKAASNNPLATEHHDPGVKEVSKNTVFVSPDAAEAIGVMYTEPMVDADGSKKRATVVIDGDNVKVIWYAGRDKDGNLVKREKSFPFEKNPLVGLHPMEFMEKSKHLGSKITEVNESGQLTEPVVPEEVTPEIEVDLFQGEKKPEGIVFKAIDLFNSITGRKPKLDQAALDTIKAAEILQDPFYNKTITTLAETGSFDRIMKEVRDSGYDASAEGRLMESIGLNPDDTNRPIITNVLGNYWNSGPNTPINMALPSVQKAHAVSAVLDQSYREARNVSNYYDMDQEALDQVNKSSILINMAPESVETDAAGFTYPTQAAFYFGEGNDNPGRVYLDVEDSVKRFNTVMANADVKRAPSYDPSLDNKITEAKALDRPGVKVTTMADEGGTAQSMAEKIVNTYPAGFILKDAKGFAGKNVRVSSSFDGQQRSREERISNLAGYLEGQKNKGNIDNIYAETQVFLRDSDTDRFNEHRVHLFVDKNGKAHAFRNLTFNKGKTLFKPDPNDASQDVQFMVPSSPNDPEVRLMHEYAERVMSGKPQFNDMIFGLDMSMVNQLNVDSNGENGSAFIFEANALTYGMSGWLGNPLAMTEILSEMTGKPSMMAGLYELAKLSLTKAQLTEIASRVSEGMPNEWQAYPEYYDAVNKGVALFNKYVPIDKWIAAMRGSFDMPSKFFMDLWNNIRSIFTKAVDPIFIKKMGGKDNARRSQSENPDNARHAELEAKHNAGTITPKETEEAQSIVNAYAKKSGYTVGPVFHATHTPDGAMPFNEFKKSNDPSKGFWFSSKNLVNKIGGNRTVSVFIKGDPKELRSDNTERNLKKLFRMFPDAWNDSPTGVFKVEDSEFGGSSYLVKDSSQIKSADPFTGVPLSERFNNQSDDIRRTSVKAKSPKMKAEPKPTNLKGFINELKSNPQLTEQQAQVLNFIEKKSPKVLLKKITVETRKTDYSQYDLDSASIQFSPIQRDNPTVALHEIIHAVSADFIQLHQARLAVAFGADYSNGNEVVLAMFKMSQDHKFNAAKHNISPDFIKLANVYTTFLKSIGITQERVASGDVLLGASDKAHKAFNEKKMPYGALNIDEFIAETISSAKFQKQLSKIPSTVTNSKSMLSEVMQFIARIVGIPFNKSNLLFDAMIASRDVITSKDNKGKFWKNTSEYTYEDGTAVFYSGYSADANIRETKDGVIHKAGEVSQDTLDKSSKAQLTEQSDVISKTAEEERKAARFNSMKEEYPQLLSGMVYDGTNLSQAREMVIDALDKNIDEVDAEGKEVTPTKRKAAEEMVENKILMIRSAKDLIEQPSITSSQADHIMDSIEFIMDETTDPLNMSTAKIKSYNQIMLSFSDGGPPVGFKKVAPRAFRKKWIGLFKSRGLTPDDFSVPIADFIRSPMLGADPKRLGSLASVAEEVYSMGKTKKGHDFVRDLIGSYKDQVDPQQTAERTMTAEFFKVLNEKFPGFLSISPTQAVRIGIIARLTQYDKNKSNPESQILDRASQLTEAVNDSMMKDDKPRSELTQTALDQLFPGGVDATIRALPDAAAMIAHMEAQLTKPEMDLLQHVRNVGKQLYPSLQTVKAMTKSAVLDDWHNYVHDSSISPKEGMEEDVKKMFDSMGDVLADRKGIQPIRTYPELDIRAIAEHQISSATYEQHTGIQRFLLHSLMNQDGPMSKMIDNGQPGIQKISDRIRNTIAIYHNTMTKSPDRVNGLWGFTDALTGAFAGTVVVSMNAMGKNIASSAIAMSSLIAEGPSVMANAFVYHMNSGKINKFLEGNFPTQFNRTNQFDNFKGRDQQWSALGRLRAGASVALAGKTKLDMIKGISSAIGRSGLLIPGDILRLYSEKILGFAGSIVNTVPEKNAAFAMWTAIYIKEMQKNGTVKDTADFLKRMPVDRRAGVNATDFVTRALGYSPDKAGKGSFWNGSSHTKAMTSKAFFAFKQQASGLAIAFQRSLTKAIRLSRSGHKIESTQAFMAALPPLASSLAFSYMGLLLGQTMLHNGLDRFFDGDDEEKRKRALLETQRKYGGASSQNSIQDVAQTGLEFVLPGASSLGNLLEYATSLAVDKSDFALSYDPDLDKAQLIRKSEAKKDLEAMGLEIDGIEKRIRTGDRLGYDTQSDNQSLEKLELAKTQLTEKVNFKYFPAQGLKSALGLFGQYGLTAEKIISQTMLFVEDDLDTEQKKQLKTMLETRFAYRDPIALEDGAIYNMIHDVSNFARNFFPAEHLTKDSEKLPTELFWRKTLGLAQNPGVVVQRGRKAMASEEVKLLMKRQKKIKEIEDRYFQNQ